MMKKSDYHIEVLMPCRGGQVEIARFDLGSCSSIVHELFDELLGEPASSGKRLLRINLILNGAGADRRQVRSVYCTLDELAENTKAIIKKAFRVLNMENSVS